MWNLHWFWYIIKKNSTWQLFLFTRKRFEIWRNLKIGSRKRALEIFRSNLPRQWSAFTENGDSSPILPQEN
ncbi:hypothetical protein D4S03_08295 [bacterium]|nr:MAG: hypothetical protein D4S03_08295 [bacterium]